MFLIDTIVDEVFWLIHVISEAVLKVLSSFSFSRSRKHIPYKVKDILFTFLKFLEMC